MKLSDAITRYLERENADDLRAIPRAVVRQLVELTVEAFDTVCGEATLLTSEIAADNFVACESCGRVGLPHTFEQVPDEDGPLHFCKEKESCR